MATLYAYSPNGTQATLSYSVIGFTQSLQQNGWCKLPNGLILQWGLYSGTQDSRETEIGPFSFPISFSSDVYSVHLELLNNDKNNPHGYDSAFQPRKLSASEFYVYQQSYGGVPWFPNFFMISFGK